MVQRLASIINRRNGIRLLNAFASLKLTVWLLVFSMLVVFFGTLDQSRFGVHHAQDIYFESVIAPTPVLSLTALLFARNFDESLAWVLVPLPGGYLLGALLVLNLLAAHFKHAKVTWRHLGISMIHGGLVLLLASGFLISAFQEESAMWITEGGQANYSRAFRDNELVLIDKSAPDTNTVHAVAADGLSEGRTIDFDKAGLSVRIQRLMPNAELGILAQNPGLEPSGATRGAAAKMGLTAVERPKTYKENERNALTAVVEIRAAGESLGSWLVSNALDRPELPPQHVTVPEDLDTPAAGRTFEIALRWQRTYFPFAIALDDFTHEKHPGTDIPSKFASDVRLLTPDGDQRRALIEMNEPLRYGGATFYQASFSPDNKSSMLQVVKNPASAVPYWAVAIMTVGLCWHMGRKLIQSRRRP